MGIDAYIAYNSEIWWLVLPALLIIGVILGSYIVIRYLDHNSEVIIRKDAERYNKEHYNA